MEKVLLSIIVASGLCAVSPHAARQYHFVYDPKNMTEALSYCREKHTDLATIDDMEDVNILNSMANLSKIVDSGHGPLAWIGLYDDVNSWRWSLSNGSFYKLEDAHFQKWRPGEPDNWFSKENCGVMYGGLWNDDNCIKNHYPVCMDVRGSSVTFVFINIPMTWAEAQSYCREHHTDLPTLTNMAEHQKVVDVIPMGRIGWLGLFRESWKWSDGSNSSFRNWKDTEPNGALQNCVAANFGNSGKWEDWPCDERKAFICYSDPVSKMVVRVRLEKTSSSLDLNDPAAMEDALTQLKQMLKDQGVNEDITLSWKKQADGKVFHKEKKTKKNTAEKRDEL